ncbi:hypothetical protein M8494_04925 [Serratia ureilytica]
MQQMMPLLAKPWPLKPVGHYLDQALYQRRAHLPVGEDGYAYCSSATGDMMLPMKNLYRKSDWKSALDLQAAAGHADRTEQTGGCGLAAASRRKATGILATLDIDLMPYLLFLARRTGAGHRHRDGQPRADHLRPEPRCRSISCRRARRINSTLPNLPRDHSVLQRETDPQRHSP